MIIDAAELKRRYLLRIAGARDNKAYIGPEVIGIGFTNSCNLTCQYCWIHGNGNPAHLEKAHHFPWEKFVGIVDDAVELNVDQIQIVGSGEPTLHPLFKDMMRYLAEKPLSVKLFTNATFPEELCDEIIKGDHVVVNLGAVDRQHFIDLQGKDLFDRVINNIRRFVALRDSIKPDFHIEIAYILHTGNINEHQKMRELAAQLRVNSVYYGRMNEVPYNKEFALPEGHPGDMGGEIKRTPPSCLNGWFHSIVNVDDNYSYCYRIAKMRSSDFDQSGFKEFWLSEQMNELRSLGKYGHVQKMFKACLTCPFYERNINRALALGRMVENEART